jgi:hypothetical protein
MDKFIGYRTEYVRPGATQLAGPKENGSASGKEAAKPAAVAAAKAQPAAAPARSTDSSSRFTFSTPASEEKLWFYRDTKVGPHCALSGS